jgi:hypothetical protein
MSADGQTATRVTVPDTKLARKADVLERYVPGCKCGSFVDIILNSDWPE